MSTPNELQVSVPISVWHQIHRLATNIAQPIVPYCFNRAEMDQATIKYQMECAEQIRRIIPEVVEESQEQIP